MQRTLTVDSHIISIVQSVWDRLPRGHRTRHAIHHVFGPNGSLTIDTVRMVADLFDGDGFVGEADSLRWDVCGDPYFAVARICDGVRHESRYRAAEDAADHIRSLREDRRPFWAGHAVVAGRTDDVDL